MITLQTLVFTAALASPAQPVLLDFYSDACGPCRSMEPAVRRLIAEGWSIRKVNVEQEQQLARRYRVDRIPTFVTVADGREVNRVVGPVSYDQLRQMLAAAVPAGASPSAPAASPPQSAIRFASTTAGQPGAVAVADADPQQRALHATVRLRITDPAGTSYGTGTVIDARGSEALVMTCGHLFRDSSGQGRIEADLFVPGADGPVPGKLLAYDLKNDVALVTIWPSVPLVPARIASPDYQVRTGDPVFSIGCDRGSEASIRPSRVTALNKYQGPANIEVAGQPVIGRSGGGLFAADGRLIGVCNAADPQDDEGLYAALSLLHEHLTANLPKGVLHASEPQIAAGAPRADAAAPPPNQFASTPLPAMPAQMPDTHRGPLAPPREAIPLQSLPSTGSAPSAALATLLQESGDDAEVICIVRSKSNPASPKQLVVIDRPSPELLNYLAAQTDSAGRHQPTVLQAEPPLVAGQPDRYQNSGRNPVLRGQSSP